MKKISYNTYFDKVFGCWIGKCIAGTIGAPFEGRKELFDFKFDSRSIRQMLPNDDLDLQVLWLEVLEKKGIFLEAEDLAEAFYNQCPYAPGEYAVFKKNYARGINPQYSGTFNNSYYSEGMGCPIRSEIWACICPGNPQLAINYVFKDGILDHSSESVYAEAFLAAAEAMAFFEKSIRKLIEIGASYIPKTSKMHALIEDVCSWFDLGHDWKYTRELILYNYGHPDCTNLFENMGIIILALLYGNEDIIDTTMMALNCGYDTDCTCATAGALIGIIKGQKYLAEKFEFSDPGYILGVDVIRRSNSVFDLAEDTCRVGLTVASELSRQIEIFDCPNFTAVPIIKSKKPLDIKIDYPSDPAVGIGESVEVIAMFTNNTSNNISAKCVITAPEGWRVDVYPDSLSIESKECQTLKMIFYVPGSIKKLSERNIINISVYNKNVILTEHSFGIVGAAVWKMYGPFWDNSIDFPPMNYWENYYDYIKDENANIKDDITRTYHLCNVADMDKQYMQEPSLELPDNIDWIKPSMEGKLINTYTDRFCVNDFIKFQGACVIYMERLLFSEENRTVGIQVGNTDACKLWINNKLVCKQTQPDWCTNENRHISDIPIKKGMNRIVFKLVRRTEKAEFSLVFSKGGVVCVDHYADFSSINPMEK